MAIIQDRCEYSSLTIPNHHAYVGVARTYVGEVAKKMGFDEQDRLMIERAVAEAVTTVIEHAFEPDERATLDISCERVPLGLKIIIADQGLPFDPTRLLGCRSWGNIQRCARPGNLSAERIDGRGGVP